MGARKYKVFVNCNTFNQSKYITETLNGFVSQQTDFPFVCSVTDDASFDGEQEVICKYLHDNFDLLDESTYFEKETDYARIISARHRSNNNCFFVVILLKVNHHKISKSKEIYSAEWRKASEYIAICEGDDFWIDKDKLQKQVRFLDTHSDFSLCFSNAKVLNVLNGHFEDDTVSSSIPQITTSEELANGNYIHTPTVMFRSDDSLLEKMNSLGPIDIGDYPTWLLVSEKGKLFKFQEQMAVYRFGSGVWSRQSDSYRITKTLVMLSKLRMVVTSPEVRLLLDSQINKLQNQIIDLNDAFMDFQQKIKRAFAYRLYHRFISIVSVRSKSQV